MLRNTGLGTMRLLRILAIAVSSSLISVNGLQMASAAIIANSQSITAKATGNWRSLLANANGAGASGSYKIIWTGGSNKQSELLAIVNTGTFDLIAQHLTFSSARNNGDTNGAPTLNFESCSGNWDNVNLTCSGTISSIASASSGQININRYLIAGNRLILRITQTRSGTGNYISTFNTLTFRSDIRSGITVNS